VVAAYVQNSALPPAELSALIIAVHFSIWAPGASPKRIIAEARKLAHARNRYWRSARRIPVGADIH
jgi:predicted transcriptional regulator